MLRAKLLEYRRIRLDNGALVQIKIWQLPTASAERPHGLKYSLFYGRQGARVIGYDNEAGKGDHRHYGSSEEPYRFTTFDNLLSDFWRDVRKAIENERDQTARG